MTPEEIVRADWNSLEWRGALETLVRDALTVAPMSTAQLFSVLGITERPLQAKLRSRLHSIKQLHLADVWRYSGKLGRFKDGKGGKVQLVEWFKQPANTFTDEQRRENQRKLLEESS